MAQQIENNARIIVAEENVKDQIEAALENPNVNVHSFSPDDSPQKKAEQAASQKPKVELGSTPKATAVISDIDKAKALETLNSLPGGIGISSKTAIPKWARVGWERVAKSESEENPATPESDYFDQVLDELYFGRLWLNAGVVFASVFATWLLTLMGFGFGGVIVICAFIATYFKHSMNRFYRNARSDISRELAKERLETDEESTEWLNEFMRRFWLIYEPVLSASIVQSVDAVLLTSTPSFLDSIRLSTFTLGTKPPHIESIKSYPKTEDDIVMMDWKLAFEPNDLANMTKLQLRNKVNPKIVLSIRVGRGVVGAEIPILLEDISFSGKLRIKLKLMNNFPHIQTVWLSFLEEPKIDFILKPIGGETFGFDIANFPGLSTFIHDQVHGSLKPMMYAPNMYELDVETMMSGVPLDAAIGVLKLTIFNAKGLKNVETFGTSDPYVKILLNGSTELAHTKVINDSLNPYWNETHFIVLTNLQDTINFELFDKNVGRDKSLGSASFACNLLQDNPRQEQIITDIILNGKKHGTLRFDAIWYPIAPQGPEDPIVESNVGILRYTIHQAKDIDAKLSVFGQYNPYAELMFNGKLVHTTKTLKRTNNPVWEESKEIFITDKNLAKLTVAIKDSRDFAEDPIVAGWTGSLNEFMHALEKNDWFNSYDKTSAKLRLSCVWKPVLLDYTPSTTGYEEPIGVIKINIKGAKNLKNVEKFGKSDPYARIRLGPMIRGRTEVIEDNLNPVWNYIHYVPIHNLKESIGFEVMDYQNSGKDRALEIQKTNGVANVLEHPTIERKNIYAELLIDAVMIPFYRTAKSKQNNPNFNEVADVFIKELDWSVLRFNIKQEDRDDPIGTLSINVKDLITNSKDDVKLSIEDLKDASIYIKAHYIPTPVKLESSESINDMGVLHVTLKSAENLLGVDRSGTSDPYVQFTYNGEKIYKSKTIKKNCNPIFDERFEVRVASRIDAKFSFEVFDWNAMHSHERLGGGTIDLSILEPFEGREISYPLDGGDKGSIRVVLLFKPGFITHKRNSMSTFSRALTSFAIPGTAVGDNLTRGGISVVNAVGNGADLVGSGAKFIGTGFGLGGNNDNKDEKKQPVEIGVLNVTLKSAENLRGVDRSGTSDPYVQFTHNGEKLYKSKTIKKNCNPTFDEKFEVRVVSLDTKIQFEVFDWNAMSSDERLGGGTIDLSFLKPFEGREISYPLDGENNGSIRVFLLYKPGATTPKRTNSLSTFITGLASASAPVNDNPAKGGVNVVNLVGNGADLVGSGAKFIGSGFGLLGNEVTDTETPEKLSTVTVTTAVPIQTPYVIEEPPLARSTNFDTNETKQEKENDHNNKDKSSLDHTSVLHSHTQEIINIYASLPDLEMFCDTNGEPGTLTVTIVEAKGLKGSTPLVKVFWGKKEVYKTSSVKKNHPPKWGESFTISTSANGESHLKFSVKDHSSILNNTDLGEVDLRVWDHVNNSSGNKADFWKDVSGGEGKLHIQLEFTPGSDRNSSDGSSGTEGKGTTRGLKGLKLKTPFRNKEKA
ncbi:2027_t:CDS:10 [Ambispora leptoticha]|uniref:2027_t:CDS:1 n=1 Tax=Ambispora leptoticha TaxID=144679 RepID=A0A9N8VFN4_9GLOM|nr:2027_t:CDS:10 [Ambispora leptoticha]